MANKNLHKAKNDKNDEFYTQYEDIEKEILNYREHFYDQVVFMNANDSTDSQFWKFFYNNFNTLGLKKIIAVHYNEKYPTYKMEYSGVGSAQATPIGSNGDFRTPAMVEILKESDIVVTNPPFSLFKEYVEQLIEYDKKFIIVGNVNALTYSSIFPLIRSNQIWWGYSPRSMDFVIPSGEVKKVNAVWWSNLETTKRNEWLKLTESYDIDKYPLYDNYDVIEVGRVADLPYDYFGIMGVPITFIDKYNPQQFEIIGLLASAKYDSYIVGVNKIIDGDARPLINGKVKYARLLIRRKQ